MSFLSRNRNDAATYWAMTGNDSSGDPTFAAAKAIQVRWEQRSTVFTGPGGEEKNATDVVFVLEDMNPGDFLFLGASAVADPLTLKAAKEIHSFSKIPQLRGRDHERRAFLGARSR